MLQQFLGLLQRGGEAKAQTEGPVPGGHPSAGKDLVQIDVAGPRPFGQGGLGEPAFFKQHLQKLAERFVNKILLVFRQKPAEIRCGSQLLLQFIRVLFHPFNRLYIKPCLIYNNVC